MVYFLAQQHIVFISKKIGVRQWSILKPSALRWRCLCLWTTTILISYKNTNSYNITNSCGIEVKSTQDISNHTPSVEPMVPQPFLSSFLFGSNFRAAKKELSQFACFLSESCPTLNSEQYLKQLETIFSPLFTFAIFRPIFKIFLKMSYQSL